RPRRGRRRPHRRRHPPRCRPELSRSGRHGLVLAGRAGDHRERSLIMTTQETGHVSGTKDKEYNLIWYVEACLDNALRLETYIKDADREGDSEVADLFRKAQADSRKG